MTITHPQHTYRFPYGEDPEINQILRLDLPDRTTACIATFVEQGMDAHDLLLHFEYFRDPQHNRGGDVVALLAAALPFTTPEGLNRTVDAGVPGERGRTAVWASIVMGIVKEGRKDQCVPCLNLLCEAGAALDGFSDDDASFNDYFIPDEQVSEIRRIGAQQRVDRARAVLTETADGIEAGIAPVARKRARL